MKQGDPLSPIIFNMVVDAVVRHWVTMMVEIVDEWIGHIKESRHQNALFYANDSMVTSLEPIWIQGAFITLVGLFDRVVLNTNVGKTVKIFCHPCQVSGMQVEAVYRIRMTGAGTSYRERLQIQVHFTECREEMALELLAIYMQT